MIRTFGKIGLIAVVFGQLAFSAAHYYLGVAHPAWPFWIAFFGASAGLLAWHVGAIRLSLADVFVVAFIGIVIANFILFGESNRADFAGRILTMCLLPYIGGRVIGKYAQFSIAAWIQALALLYVLLIGLEFLIHPALFRAADRLYLFAAEGWEIDGGGDPTQFNIGITLGSAWVTAFVALVLMGQRRDVPISRGSLRLTRAIVLLFPPLLLLIGSRTCVVSMLASGMVLLFAAPWVAWHRKLAWVVIPIVALALVYPIVPESRKAFLREVPKTITGMGDFLANSGYCSQKDGSLFNRVVLISEAWRLFRSSPVVGVGAGNYGLKWCGEKAEFAGPHSSLAQVLAEEGLLGFVAFVLLNVTVIGLFLACVATPEGRTDLALWSVFGVWLFDQIQAQSIGNIFFDYHAFLLTGFLVSALRLTRRRTVARLRVQSASWPQMQKAPVPA